MSDITSLTARLRRQVLRQRPGGLDSRDLSALIQDAVTQPDESSESDAEPLLLLAYLASESDQNGQARRMLDLALRRQPDHPRALALRGYLDSRAS